MLAHQTFAAVLVATIYLAPTPSSTFAAINEDRANQKWSGVAGANENSEIVGRWEWTLNLGPTSGKITMDVKRSGDKLSATLVTPEGKRIAPKEFIVKDGQVTIRVERQRGFVKVKLLHSGAIKGSTITGEFHASGGPINKRGQWQAKRVATKQR